MGIQRKYWKYFLVDTPTKFAWYETPSGQFMLGNVFTSNVGLELPEDPDGWLDNQVSFGRNSHYWGLNRTFTIPLKFIKTGARIIRNVFYKTKGIESPLTLLVFKWDYVLGYYRLYYNGLLDLTQFNDNVAEGVTVNIIQGGVTQLLKAYENLPIEIPLDGSIPENIKVLADGILLDDVFHYQILNIAIPIPGVVPLPCAFLSNDGDNVGIQHGDQIVEAPYADYYQKSSNFIFTSISPITVRIQGQITVRSDARETDTIFYLFTATSLSQPRGVGSVDHAKGLILPQDDESVDPSGIFTPLKSQVVINGYRTFAFDTTVNLSANEHLFIFFFNNFATYPIDILGGQFTLSFSSRYPASRVWGITMWDAFRLLIKNICAFSSNFAQIFNFGAESTLLQQYLRFVLTSGDAIRASTTPDYYQYFNLTTINPTNPNNQFYNGQTTLGPVLKTCLSDLFDAANPILNASLGNQMLPGDTVESLFIEDKKYVLDSSVITMTLNKIANFKVTVALDYYFNWLKIGYNLQQYDETAGKFEYNTTFQWQTSIKQFQKVLELICKYRTDSYGFEYTRYNTQGGKSSTFNNSDNDVFIMNTDFTKFIYDYYKASFVSQIQDTASTSMSNQKPVYNQDFQPITLDTLDGEYFLDNIDFSIFILNQPTPGTQSINVNAAILLNGLPTDSCIVKMWINGVVFQQWTQQITGVNTALNIAFVSSRAFLHGDCIYFTIQTINTCTAQITQFTLNVGAGYFIAETTGVTTIQAGTTQQQISLPLVTPTFVTIDSVQKPVVSYGFQYFTFLSGITNRQFNSVFMLSALIQGGVAGQVANFTFWKNGVPVFNAGPYAATVVQSTINAALLPLDNFVSTLNNFDIFFITVSCQNVNVWITNAYLQFNSLSIKAYNLLREIYTSVTGIPHPETAFNIADLTPRRILQKNSSLLNSILFNQVPGMMNFQTADKNQFLSTVRASDGEAFNEDANIDLHDLDAPLFYPFVFEFDTEVPDFFNDILSNAANGHIEFIYKNISFFGFPLTVTSKPALRESQTWKLLCSTKTDLTQLVDLDWDGLLNLNLMDSTIPIVCPVHFVPLGYTKDARYNSYTMDEKKFKQRIKDWVAKQDYFAPWQTNDFIELQCQTNGLSPCTVQLLDVNGTPVAGVAILDLDTISDPAIRSPQQLFQGTFELNTLSEGIYFMLWSMGTGQGTAVWISEGLYVKKYWAKTQLYEYINTTNKLGTIFTSNYQPSMRLHSQLTRFTPKSKFSTFNDEPQDADLLNAIPYDTWTLQIGFDSGIPDYMMRKIDRIMLLDTVLIDGDQYTRDGDANMEKTNFPGQPKEYLEINIRRAKNIDAITYNSSGQLTSDQLAGYTIDPTAFGDGTEQPLLEVTNS